MHYHEADNQTEKTRLIHGTVSIAHIPCLRQWSRICWPQSRTGRLLTGRAPCKARGGLETLRNHQEAHELSPEICV